MGNLARVEKVSRRMLSDDIDEAQAELGTLTSALDELLADVLPHPNQSMKQLATNLGYSIQSSASNIEPLSTSIILVPFHFSDPEARHRIARAIVRPLLKGVIDSGLRPDLSPKSRDTIEALLKRVSFERLLDILASVLLIPTVDFNELPDSVRYNARSVADKFVVPLSLAIERARTFGLVPA